MRSLFLILSLLIVSCASEPSTPEVAKPPHAHLKTLFPEGVLNMALTPIDLGQLNDKVIAFYFVNLGNPHAPKTTELISKLAVNYDYRFKVVVVNPHGHNMRFKDSFSDYQDIFHTINTSQAIALTEKYRIQTVPSIIAIDSEGKLITRNGLDAIINNTPRLPGGWN